MEDVSDRRHAASRILKRYGGLLKRQQVEHRSRGRSGLPSSAVIGYSACPHEARPLRSALESDDSALNKVVIAFAALCEENDALRREALRKHYVFLSFYERRSEIAAHVGDLCELAAFIERCHRVVFNFRNQIVNLHSKTVRLDFVLDRLGDTLVTLIVLDCLVNASPLYTHFTRYRKAIRTAERRAGGPTSVRGVLDNIENAVFRDRIFQNCLDSLKNVESSVNGNGSLVAEDSAACLKRKIARLEKITADRSESGRAVRWVKTNALFVFHHRAFGNVDKKLFQSLLDVNVKAHTVPLFGPAVWYPERFLLRHADALCASPVRLSQSLIKVRQSYVTAKRQTLSKEVYATQAQAVRWALRLVRAFAVADHRTGVVDLNQRTELLIQGIEILAQINHTVTTFLSIHLGQNMSITKSSLMAICRLIEILKGVHRTFETNSQSIVSSLNLIEQHLLYQIVTHLSAAKKKFTADNNYKSHLDELTAVFIAERALRGPPTVQRKTVANVALSVVPSATFPDDGHDKIVSLLERLETVMSVPANADYFSDCLFLYWHKAIVPVYLESVLSSKKDIVRFEHIMDALNDSADVMVEYEKSSTDRSLSFDFENEIRAYLDRVLLKPLSQRVETNLRLHVHSHLQSDSTNPFSVAVEDNTVLLSMKRFKLNDTTVSIGDDVEHYLSHTFYNLTTVVLHDWKTYREMRQLAKFKFDLDTVEDELPTQTLEQGLDVLEIMRNIDVFVSKYFYNLNNQVFVERNSNNKYLNTINIRHIANSIRTHGIGIMNTTVNFTYQFLRKQFHTFSQFMYDEQIKSRLVKDLRHFREASSVSEQMYGYKRAEKFNKGIRKLGVDQEGHSYLDSLRLLISHIGNAMGYVRMIRSGGLHCCAIATSFLPSLDSDSYDFPSKIDHSNPLVKDTLENLNSTIGNLTSNFSHGTDYFKLLVNAFVPFLQNPDQMHLRTFYMIVPPLTINFVENMLLSKDKMSKKNKTGAGFTDDGFAMGLAYILKLLDQDDGMDSLNWFKSVTKHVNDERRSIIEQTTSGSDHLRHALALTEKKLNFLEQEFQLLYFSFSSARIFFQ